MTLKKKTFEEGEEPIFDDAVIYKRGEYWQFRMWLVKEHKYARFSLKTRNKSTAIDKAKLHYHELKAGELAGKKYFSLTTKIGVEKYLENREKEIGQPNGIVKGRYGTIKTHLEHWLNFIGRDVKLKELERTDGEDYLVNRTKGKKKLQVSTTTIANEQSTINAMMKWLYKRGETYIDSFDFKKLPRIDTGDEANRRNTFTDYEFDAITIALRAYIAEAEKDLSNEDNLTKAIGGYYLGVSLLSGMRRGEQMQLTWGDVVDMEHKRARSKEFDLVKITVRGVTSKTRKTRRFAVKDSERYLERLFKLAHKLHFKNANDSEAKVMLAGYLVFSNDGTSKISARTIGYHFDKILGLAKVNRQDRDLVPYSCRHYFITKRVNSNVPITAIAEMCGTSIAQIERTYYHTTDEKMVSNALADYTVQDGMYVSKQ
ncbi:tyrosine-type recombinase/integrase [Polynucleobacter sinensis]|uniref:tyrosine-type recombinase/integrase n=1 Tax=Polynucleobacter sinensis TaxID=1743157 RepID=UPI000785A761|nr:tyrosine-type recombinase/integrase [Polynucleobacter sinensis]